MLLAHATKTIIAGALMAGSAALSGWGVGMAHADTMEPHQWCPGNPKQMPYVVNQYIDWDWSVCHTWYPTNTAWATSLCRAGRPRSGTATTRRSRRSRSALPAHQLHVPLGPVGNACVAEGFVRARPARSYAHYVHPSSSGRDRRVRGRDRIRNTRRCRPHGPDPR